MPPSAAPQAGDSASALRTCESALRDNALTPEHWLGRAGACLQSGDFRGGAAAAAEAASLAPHSVLARKILGAACAGLGDPGAALNHYAAAVALDGRDKEAHNGVAAALNDLREFARALAASEITLSLWPDFAPAHYNRGVALAALGRPEDAIASYRQALAQNPDFVEALNNCAVLLARAQRSGEAIKLLDRTVERAPDYAPAHANRGRALADLGRDAEALASCERALALNPNDAESGLTRAHLLLAAGDVREGLAALEWRRRLPAWTERRFAFPEWRGGQVSGAKILVWAEQGLGDTLHFSRYASLLAARGAAVTLAVQNPVRWLLAKLPGVRVIGLDQTSQEAHDAHTPLMSLPRLLGLDAADLFVEPARLDIGDAPLPRWRAKLRPELFHVGVAWQGNPSGDVDRGRSFPLAALAPLGRLPGVKLWSLQKNAGAEQMRDIAGLFAVEDPGPDFDAGPDAFIDTAALMASLDLIVTCDTALAHLAGSLRRPVWIALQVASEWRWLRDRDDSPFYPTARLFRQSRPGDWPELFRRMEAALGERRFI